MDNTLLKWSREIVGSVQIALDRIKNKNLSNKDHKMVLELTGDLIEAQKQSADSKNIAELFTKIQIEFEYPDLKEVNTSKIKEHMDTISNELDNFEKLNHLAAALQLDAQSIMPLEEQIREKREEIRQSFQKAVDLDLKLYGAVSEITSQAISAYHFDINKDMQVIPVNEYTVEKTVPKEETAMPESRQPEQQAEGKTVDEKTAAIEYLHIPPQGKEQFAKTIQYFKDNGAKFDRHSKHWFVTKQCNRELFAEYLTKNSVIARIGQKQNEIKGQDTKQEAPVPHQSRQKEQTM